MRREYELCGIVLALEEGSRDAGNLWGTVVMNTNVSEVNSLLSRQSSVGEIKFSKLSEVQQQKLTDFLKEILPSHGSISENWHFQFRKSEIILHSSYECVDPDGRCRKWVPFEISVYEDFSYRLEFRFEAMKSHTMPLMLILEQELEDVFTEENAEKWVTFLGEIVSSKRPEKHCWLN